MRTPEHLYIRNFKPQRWPAGAPQKYRADGSGLEEMHLAYHDIDASPTLTRLIEGREEEGVGRYLDLAVGKRPAEELFDLAADPGCLDNLADQPEHADLLKALREEFDAYLAKTGDARATGNGRIWDEYVRYSSIRQFPKPPDAGPDY